MIQELDSFLCLPMTELKRSTASAAAAAADVAPFVPMIPEEKRGRLSFDAFVVVVVVDYSPRSTVFVTHNITPDSMVPENEGEFVSRRRLPLLNFAVVMIMNETRRVWFHFPTNQQGVATLARRRRKGRQAGCKQAGT